MPRALRAVPLLVTSGFMLFAFRFAAPLTPYYEPAVAAGVITVNGIEVPLFRRFYGFVPLDEVLSRIMIAFAQILTFPVDVEGYWHMLVFLLEFTGLYAAMLLESCRGGRKDSWLRL